MLGAVSKKLGLSTLLTYKVINLIGKVEFK